MSNSRNFFEKKKVANVDFQLLPEGIYNFRLEEVAYTDSFSDQNGNQKESLPDWHDATPVIYTKWKATAPIEVDGKFIGGVVSERFNGAGYVKWDELTDKQKESGKFVRGNHSDGSQSEYALVEKDGVLVRIRSEEHTEQADRILSQMLRSCGVEAGANPVEVLTPGLECSAKVEHVEYNGKKQARMTGWRPVREEAEEVSEEADEIDDFEN